METMCQISFVRYSINFFYGRNKLKWRHCAGVEGRRGSGAQSSLGSGRQVEIHLKEIHGGN